MSDYEIGEYIGKLQARIIALEAALESIETIGAEGNAPTGYDMARAMVRVAREAREGDKLARRVGRLERRVTQLEAADSGNAICLVCGSAMQLVRPGKWQCNTCDARRWYGAPVLLDDDTLSDEE